MKSLLSPILKPIRLKLTQSLFGICSLFCSVMVMASPSNALPSSPPVDIKLQINWNYQFEFAGFIAAIKQGYYRDLGLNVQLQSWQKDVDVLTEVTSNRVQFGVGYGGMVVADFAKGIPVQLVMPIYQFSPVVLLAHHPVTQFSDLQGKTLSNFHNLYIESLLKKMSDEANASDKIKFISASGDLQDFIDNKVDIYGAYETNEPYRLKKLGVHFYILDPKAYGVQGYGSVIFTSVDYANQHPEIVQKFKQASIKGWKYALSHQAATVDYLMAHYPVVKTRDALLDEASKTERFIKPGDVPIGNIDLAKISVLASEAKDTGLITQQQLDDFKPSKVVFAAHNVKLTDAERTYLQHHPVVTLANDPHWGPFQYIDDRGRYQGIAADYFKLLAENLGIKFVINRDKPWNAVVAMAEKGQLEVYPCAAPTPDRKKYMNFTPPYLSFPMVLVGKNNMSFVSEYGQLNDKAVAVVKGGWAAEYLQRHYPHIKMLAVKSVKDGLEAVINGQALAFSGNLGVINFTLNQYGLTGLHVVGQSGETFDIAVGVQKNNPLLFSILEKGLAAITPEQRSEIYNRWVKLEVVQRLDKSQLILIAAVVFFLITSLVLWGLMYRYQKNKRETYIKQVHELTYANLIEVSGFTIERASESLSRLTGYSQQELLGMDYFKLAPNDMPDSARQAIAKLVLAGNVWSGEMKGVTKEGKDYWVELTLSPVTNFWGDVTHVWATRVDITDKKRIEQVSIVDELTGLYNRRYFNEVIVKEINRAKRQNTSLSVAMLDIDFFKKVNDTYGHQKGDEVLAEVASCFAKDFHRATDFVFRMGGEEFLILSSFGSKVEFKRYLDKLCAEVRDLNIENQGASFGVLTISIGAAYCEAEDLSNADKLYHQADENLYQAKALGRNQVVI